MSTLATEVEVNFSPLVHRYTLEEFWELPDPGDLSHDPLPEVVGCFEERASRLRALPDQGERVREIGLGSNLTRGV